MTALFTVSHLSRCEDQRLAIPLVDEYNEEVTTGVGLAQGIVDILTPSFAFGATPELRSV